MKIIGTDTIDPQHIMLMQEVARAQEKRPTEFLAMGHDINTCRPLDLVQTMEVLTPNAQSFSLPPAGSLVGQ
jgi:hypothetical protein